MVVRCIKKKIFTFMLGILLGIGTMAYAATAYSSWGYYGPYLGYSYQNQAYVSDNSRVYASTLVQNQNSGNVPTGYMGVQARLFKSDVLYTSTEMTYNSSASWALSVPTQGGTDFPSGTYYSKGITAAYNGNGYTTYYTFQSPSINH